MNMRKNYVRPAINSMAFKERLMCSQSNKGPGATDIYSGWGDDYYNEHQDAKHYSVWDER